MIEILAPVADSGLPIDQAVVHERLAAVRLAVQAPWVKLASFTGRRLSGAPAFAMAGA